MATADVTTFERTKYARQAMVVFDVLTDIMRELALDTIKPTTMYNLIQNLSFIKDKLTYEEKNTLETLQSDGYSKCDIILLYKLIRQQLPKPGLGWGKAPLKSNLSISDDIERIRFARNKLVHRPKTDVTEIEENDFFQEFKSLARRVDLHLNKQMTNSFEQKIALVQISYIDSIIEDRYIQRVKEQEGLKLKLSDNRDDFSINIYCGNDIDVAIDCGKSGDSEKKRMKIVVTGVANENQIIDEINSIKDDLNKENFMIAVQDVRHGSIIIDVVVLPQALQSENVFLRELTKVLRFMFCLRGTIQYLCKEIDIVVLRYDELLDNDYDEILSFSRGSTQDDDDPRYNPDDLILTVDVDDSMITSENQLYQATSDLVSNMLSRVNECHNVSGEHIDVILHSSVRKDSVISERCFI